VADVNSLDYKELWLRKNKLQAAIPKAEAKVRELRAELEAIEQRIKAEDERFTARQAAKAEWFQEDPRNAKSSA
jgi:hypothetical protein